MISHDRRTMTRYFRERLAAGKSSPGLFIVPQRRVLAEVIESSASLDRIANCGVARCHCLPPVPLRVFYHIESTRGAPVRRAERTAEGEAILTGQNLVPFLSQ